MVLRAVLQTVTVTTMAGVLVIVALLAKSRKDKIVKAASPSLLYLILFGSLLSYSEILLSSRSPGHITCMLVPWIHHVGFSITYGALLIKTWRISVIMRMFTAKVPRTNDSQLFRAVAILVVVTVAYMTVWTVTDPLIPTEVTIVPHTPEIQTLGSSQTPIDKDMVFVCILPWWDYVISAGEFGFLIWGAALCYQARKAPDMYNETRPISYAIWNEALWCVFNAYATGLLAMKPDSNMAFVLCFLRTQCTVTVTLLLLFVPKFMTVFSTLRELRGTLSDVYGAKRIHRLSLVLNKNGAIKTVYCVPCGPLTYTEGPDDEEDEGDSESETGENVKENHYTKAEVDTLIEMVSRLKTEKNLYKSQVRRLCQLLKEHRQHKAPMNGLPVGLVAETPEREDLPLVSAASASHLPHTPVDGSCNPIFHDLALISAHSSTHTLPQNSSDVPVIGCNINSYNSYMTPHSRKASTVISYLSSTPDNMSLNGESSDLIDDDQREDSALYDVSKKCVTPSVRSPVSVYPSSLDMITAHFPPSSAGTPVDITAGSIPDVKKPSKADLDLPLADSDLHHCESCSNSDSDGDFPRLLQPHDKRLSTAGSPQELQDFISTICGIRKSKKRPASGKKAEQDTGGGQMMDKSHEMETLKNNKTPIPPDTVRLSNRQPTEKQSQTSAKNSADKMSFVMYI